MPTLALLNDLGGGEVVIIVVIALMFFGKNLPTVIRTIGKTVAQIKHSLSEATTEVRTEINIAADSLKDIKTEIASSLHVDMSDAEMPKIDLKTQDTFTHLPTEKNEPTPQDLDRPKEQIETLAQPENTLRKPLIRPAIGTVRSSALSKAAALDRLDVPAPTKMPPSLDD